ncbi:MAG: tyrosine-type recombinase/integrase [Acidithiobacillus ferrooxidans]
MKRPIRTGRGALFFTSQHLPVVLTPSEARALLYELSGTMWLIASMLYGTGMRLLEGLRLRIKDVEFERREIIIRDGKGAKDRVTVLPENILLPLKKQMEKAKLLHDTDNDVNTTMIYTHVLNKGGRGIISPLDM